MSQTKLRCLKADLRRTAYLYLDTNNLHKLIELNGIMIKLRKEISDLKLSIVKKTKNDNVKEDFF